MIVHTRDRERTERRREMDLEKLQFIVAYVAMGVIGIGLIAVLYIKISKK